jgi:hypothetical protein
VRKFYARLLGGRKAHEPQEWVVSSMEVWDVTETGLVFYITADGTITHDSAWSDYCVFPTKEAAETALIAAKIRGDAW